MQYKKDLPVSQVDDDTVQECIPEVCLNLFSGGSNEMTLLTSGLIYSELLPRLVAVVNTGSRTNDSAQLCL